MRLRTLIAVATFVFVASVVSIAAAAATFTGPTGDWKPNDPSGDAVRHVDSWKNHLDHQSTLTVVTDTATSYADALAPVTKNIADNHIKTSVDKDETCLGKPAHVVEYTFGPDGHQVAVNRTVAAYGTGSIAITYLRDAENPFDPEVRKAIDAFCAQPG